MTEDNFKWTDELVMEIIGLTHRAGYHKEPAKVYDRVIQFKQSKLQSQDKPQPSSIDRIEVSMSTINFDKQVLNPYPTDSWKHAAWENGFMEAINKYIKPTPTTQPTEEDKPVLFITEDGVEIRNGDHAFYVQDDNNWMVVSHSGITEKRPYPYFHTSESANKWVLENKPCLSLNEVKELANNNGAKVLCIPDEKISNYTKQKLKQ